MWFDSVNFCLLAPDIGSSAGYGFQALEPLCVLLNWPSLNSLFYLLVSLPRLLYRLLAFSVAASGLWFSWWMLCSLRSTSFPGWRSYRLASQALAAHDLFWASARRFPWLPLNQRLRLEYQVSAAMPSPTCSLNFFLLSPRDHERCSTGHDLTLISSSSDWSVRICPFSENYPLGFLRLIVAAQMTTLSLFLWAAWDPSIVLEVLRL